MNKYASINSLLKHLFYKEYDLLLDLIQIITKQRPMLGREMRLEINAG